MIFKGKNSAAQGVNPSIRKGNHRRFLLRLRTLLKDVICSILPKYLDVSAGHFEHAGRIAAQLLPLRVTVG